jgi:hypothetical protein
MTHNSLERITDELQEIIQATILLLATEDVPELHL